jgi:hypothetical protein
VPVFVGGRFSVLVQRELEQIGAQPLGDNFALGLRLIEAGLASSSSGNSSQIDPTQVILQGERRFHSLC